MNILIRFYVNTDYAVVLFCFFVLASPRHCTFIPIVFSIGLVSDRILSALWIVFVCLCVLCFVVACFGLYV